MKTGNLQFATHTGTNIRKNLQKRFFLILPVGNIENHGPHLPVGTDALIAEEISLRLATALTRRFPKARFFVSPPVAIGNVTTFGKGTGLSAGRALLGYLKEICNNALKSGIAGVIIVNGCGGNDAIITKLAKKNDKIFYLPKWWRITKIWKIDESFNKFLEEGGNVDDWVGTHGSELETSIMLALEKRYKTTFVKKNKIFKAKGPCSRSIIICAQKHGDFDKIAQRGVLGDATRASAKKGENICNAVINTYLKKLSAFVRKEKR